jgi:hypothetical protein
MVRILRGDAEKLLAAVPEQHAFRCHDGSTLRDMRELSASLPRMSDDTFYYHSNQEKKDFSNWVRDVIGDQKLARDLEKARDRTEAAKKAAERVAFLSGKLS